MGKRHMIGCKRPRILCVDDEPVNLKLLEAMLASRGYEVVSAENGEQAIEKIREEKLDLVLLDIQMPVMDGLDAVKILKKTPGTENIKMIALTSFAMTGDRERIMAAGFDDYISKPVDTEKLVEIVEKYLGKQKGAGNADIDQKNRKGCLWKDTLPY